MNEKYKSVNIHDSANYYNWDLETWKTHNEKHEKESFNNLELKCQDLLDKHPEIRDIAIDIGSGGGWMSNKLSKIFKKVYAIEPSEKAIQICKALYKERNNIEWINKFAEDAFDQLNVNIPCFYNTCSVFMHIPNEFVEKTLFYINNYAKAGSIISMQECWTEKLEIITPPGGMTYFRNKDWWKEKLSNWELDFFGPDMSKFGHPFINTNKGIHGFKVK